MSCLNIHQSAPDVSPKFHIEKTALGKDGESCFFRDHFRVYNLLSGYVTLTSDNEENMRLACGDICILPPNKHHSLRANTASAELYVFTFSIDFIEHILQHQAGSGGMLSRLFNSGSPTVIAPVPADMQIHLQHLMEFMRYEYERGGSSSELTLRNCLATLFCVFLELLRNSDKIAVPHSKSSILYAISYVKENYQKNLSADKTAELICMSKKDFVTRFKQFSGRSFHDFLNKTRIEKATEILKKADGKITLSQLSQLCGYENYITFYRNFIKYTGLSPVDYLS